MLILKLLSILKYNPLLFFVAVFFILFPLIISITIHEWAHGFVAYKLGDNTPKLSGRLTLNPLAHIDLIGTIMLFVVGIGWAKPVPINTANLKNKYNVALVGVAGPLSNVILAVLFSIIGVICFKFKNNNIFYFITLISIYLTQINFLLALFNLMPIPPLDGSRIISAILPEKLQNLYSKIERYGFIIIIAIAFNGGFSVILTFSRFLQNLLYLFLNKII
ncbi:MAG: site-2 protease family protein [bacterium]